MILHASLNRIDSRREKDKLKILKREMKNIFEMPVKVMLVVVVGALGPTSKKLKQQLSNTGIETRIVELQKTTILYFARIQGLRNLVT